MSFPELTKNTPRKLMLAAMRVLAPKAYLEFAQYLNFVKLYEGVPRPFTCFLQKEYGLKPLVGVEIGFGYGENAENLLSTLNLKKLYCVDPYIFQPYVRNNKAVFYNNSEKSKYSVISKDPRVTFINKTSDDAFHELPFDLDFFYVDGNHDFNYVVRDINNSLMHLKKGGFVGGHDYGWFSENMVVQAVHDVAVEIKQVPTIHMPDYWFTKN